MRAMALLFLMFLTPILHMWGGVGLLFLMGLWWGIVIGMLLARLPEGLHMKQKT